MYVQARRRWLNMPKKNKNKREDQRKKAQTLKAFLNCALKRPTQEGKPWCLMKQNAEGEMGVIDESTEVMKEEINFTETHMGKGRQRWYINEETGKIIQPYCTAT